MLDPCNPCVCGGAPCEQCSFGYRSKKDNHESMKKLLLAYAAGERPTGWAAAQRYMEFHRDWKKELGLEETAMLETKETNCSNCIHCPVCANKNIALDIQKQLDEMCVGEFSVRDITWAKLTLNCEHFRRNVPTVRGV